MATYTVQVVLNPSSNIPRDIVTNTWCTVADDVTALNLFMDELVTFYGTARPIFSSQLPQIGHRMKAYDVSDPEPRAPVAERTWNFPVSPSGASLPTECGICLSFQGVRTSGVNQARRRGRVYLGPLNVSTIDSNGRVSGATQVTVRTAGEDLLQAAFDATTWNWAIRSPLSIGGFVPVNNGWVDNAIDIQRRRGVLSTSRVILGTPS